MRVCEHPRCLPRTTAFSQTAFYQSLSAYRGSGLQFALKTACPPFSLQQVSGQARNQAKKQAFISTRHEAVYALK
jgi:hypothetical protein